MKGRLVNLRPPEPEDLDLLNGWANDAETWRDLGGWHFPYSRRSTEAWIAAQDGKDPHRQSWVIEADGFGAIGTTSLVNIDWKNRHAEYGGIQIGDRSARGRGFAQDVCFIVMRLVFEDLGLHRLDGRFIGHNERSIYVHQTKCGWTKEGVLRDYYFREGGWQDCVIMGITAPEYRALAASTGYWAKPVAQVNLAKTVAGRAV